MEGVSDEQKPDPQSDQLGMEERRSRLVEAGRSRIMSPATAFSIDSLLKPELRTNSLSFPSSRVKPEYHHHDQRSIKPELEASLQETRIVWWRAKVNDVLLDLELWIVDDFHVVGGEQTVGPVRTQTLIKNCAEVSGFVCTKIFQTYKC